MKIGYPCINQSLQCRSSRTFRLRSYSQERFMETVTGNLSCLREILSFNVAHDILFFRVSSDLIPFASHPVCDIDWFSAFADEFRDIGRYIKDHDIRISMHPDQFIVLNSIRPDVVDRSIAELVYHATVLDAMELDTSAKIQLHVGGVYGARDRSIERFISVYGTLPVNVKRRLVIEDDDRHYSLADALRIHAKTGVPVLLDVFHHELLNNGEPIDQAIAQAKNTWNADDGIPMVDYSCQKEGGRRGSHCNSIDLAGFRLFLERSRGHDIDVMLEIKDKEKSALVAIRAARDDPRFIPRPAGSDSDSGPGSGNSGSNN